MSTRRDEVDVSYCLSWRYLPWALRRSRRLASFASMWVMIDRSWQSAAFVMDR